MGKLGGLVGYFEENLRVRVLEREGKVRGSEESLGFLASITWVAKRLVAMKL